MVRKNGDYDANLGRQRAQGSNVFGGPAQPPANKPVGATSLANNNNAGGGGSTELKKTDSFLKGKNNHDATSSAPSSSAAADASAAPGGNTQEEQETLQLVKDGHLELATDLEHYFREAH